ncbi:MAG TPA: aminotransferase class I/II-fold pyridoxal phosphate-dependent enzyme [Solirubrobacteraceae bacterium]|nr:aminotransferase class I/II-fold pyridoxal phosphate-dependent enzyme [Solirubrobacteraceae bacterium]
MPEQYQIRGSTAGAIAASVETAIASGELVPGASLPSVRDLARRLEVSPTTVAAAFAELRRRGAIISRPRSGTRVAERPPLGRPVPVVPAGARDLATGNPDLALLPELPPLTGPQRPYGAEPVLPELAALAAAAFAADGIASDRVCAVNGALDGIERVLTAHLAPGDAVAVEDPGWTGVFDLCRMLGLRLVGIPVDERGMLPEALAAADARAVVVTPRGHNPLGAAVDAERAGALRRALPDDVLVVEDDHLGPVAGTPYETLVRDRPRWAAVRSVSKWLGPDLRLAVLTGDPTTLARVEGRQALGPGWVSGLIQRLAVHMWSDADVLARVAGAAEVYRARREAFATAAGVPAPPSGINVWVPVPDEDAVVRALLADGWAVAAGTPYRLSGGPAIRVTTAALSVDEAPALAAALGRAVAPAVRTRAA